MRNRRRRYGWGRNAPNLVLPSNTALSVGHGTNIRYIVAQVGGRRRSFRGAGWQVRLAGRMAEHPPSPARGGNARAHARRCTSRRSGPPTTALASCCSCGSTRRSSPPASSRTPPASPSPPTQSQPRCWVGRRALFAPSATPRECAASAVRERVWCLRHAWRAHRVQISVECCYQAHQPITTLAFRVHTHTLGRSVTMEREAWNRTGARRGAHAATLVARLRHGCAEACTPARSSAASIAAACVCWGPQAPRSWPPTTRCCPRPSTRSATRSSGPETGSRRVHLSPCLAVDASSGPC